MAIELTSDMAFTVTIIAIVVELIAIYIVPKKGWAAIRRLPALDAAEEAVHICSEKGKTLFYEMGHLGVGLGSMAPHPGYYGWIPAIMSLIKHLSTVCAKVGVKMNLVGYDAVGVTMARDYMREGYTIGGRGDIYSPDNVIYIPNYVVGMLYSIDIIKREKPGAGIVIGAHWWANSVSLVEALNIEDSFCVAGTVYPADNAPAAIAADVATFGEENIAIGSYLSQDALSSSCLIGEDVVKLGLMACCIIAPILVTFFGVVI
jgi:hypothetical protein